MTHRFIFTFVTTLAVVSLADAAGVRAQASAATIPIAGARLMPSKTPEGIRWDARYIVDLDASSHFDGGTIAFAAPLATGERLEPSPGVSPIVDPRTDRITAIAVERSAVHGRTIQARFVAHELTESAPIARGSSVQIVEPPSRMIIDVDPLHGFEKHVGYVAPRTIGHSAREEARRLTGTPIKLTENLVYVRGDDVRPDMGFKATLVDQGRRSQRGAAGVAVLFLGIVAGLGIAAKRLARAASAERAERILKAEIDGLTPKKTHRA